MMILNEYRRKTWTRHREGLESDLAAFIYSAARTVLTWR